MADNSEADDSKAEGEAEEEVVDLAKDEGARTEDVEKAAQHIKVEHHKVFNPTKDLPENFFMILYGMRRCGKSTTLNYMLYSMRKRLKSYRVYLFSSTAKVDPGQYKYFPKDHRFHDLELLDEELGRITEEQEELMDSKDDKEREALMEKNKVLVVMDDCVNESTIRRSQNLNGLAVHGRHLGVSVIILSQCVAGSGSVPPIVRTQADAIMLCTLPRSVRERDLLHENYLTAEDNQKSKEKSRALMDQVTSVQYRNMVVAMWDTSVRRSRDYVYTYGPVPEKAVPDDFQLGSPEQWEDEDESSDGGDGHSVNGEEDEKDAEDGGGDGENTKRSDAVHGGGLKNLGIQAAVNDLKEQLMKELSEQARADTTNYLPPAFAAGKGQKQFRSFVQYSMTGARETVPQESYKYEVDGIWEEDPTSNRLQGQRHTEPGKVGKKRKQLSEHKKKRVKRYSSLLKKSAGKERAQSTSARQGSAFEI